MTIPSKADWRLGEVLADPQRLFVLWLVMQHPGLGVDDLRRTYGEEPPWGQLLGDLVADGFLRRYGEPRSFELTEEGERAVAPLVGTEVGGDVASVLDQIVRALPLAHVSAEKTLNREAVRPEPGSHRRFFDVLREGPVTVVKFTEKHLNDTNVPHIGDELAGLADILGKGELRLDFSEVQYLGPVAMAKFVQLHLRMQKAGGRLVLINLGAMYELFTVTRLNTFMEVYRAALQDERPR